jgi:hypothetical protein
MIDPNRVWRVIIVLAALAVLCLWMLVARVMAHDWYPTECCSGIDCAPVMSTSYVASAILDGHDRGRLPMPRMVVTTSRGTFVLPDDMPRRVSKDNRMHVCSSNTGRVLCIFEPPGM